MQMCHSDVDTFRKSVGSTRKRPISKRQLSQIVPVPRCAYLVHFTGVTGRFSSCGLWMFQIRTMANFEFMNFWSFLTRPGDKHDAEKTSNCSSTPRRSRSKLTIRPWVSRCFNFSHDKTPNLMVFSEIFWNEMCLCSLCGAKVWNEIPCNIRQLPKNKFKKTLCKLFVGILNSESDSIDTPTLIKKVKLAKNVEK